MKTSNSLTLQLPHFAAFASGSETSETKAQFAETFIRFVESGFKRSLFKKAFYKRLSNSFGHIAHYNIDGFYEAQFSDTAKQIAFVKQALEWPCFGAPEYTFSDVERFLKDWLRRSGTLNRLLAAQREENISSELKELNRLQQKYPHYRLQRTQGDCNVSMAIPKGMQ